MKAGRHSRIVEILDDRNTASVADLSAELDVSEMTIRRDLLELERTGILRRIHGGATRTTGRAYEPPFRVRQMNDSSIKRAIAKAAAAMIDDGDALGIDVGSTVLEIVPQITVSNLTIVTASLRVAMAVAEHHALEQTVRLISTGGVLRAEELSFTGQAAVQSFGRFRIDKAFLGVGGLSVANGATEFNLEDSDVKRAMVQSANSVIVLADSGKLENVGFAEVCPIEDIDVLVTDDRADPALLETFRAAGVEVVVAPVG